MQPRARRLRPAGGSQLDNSADQQGRDKQNINEICSQNEPQRVPPAFNWLHGIEREEHQQRPRNHQNKGQVRVDLRVSAQIRHFV